MLRKFNIIKLSFTGPLHLSNGKNDYDSSEIMVHSDTLKAALFSCAIQLYGEKEINKGFLEAFRLSSTFPYFRDQLFLPKPLKDIDLFDGVKDDDLKKIKKIAYLSVKTFEKVAQGNKLDYKSKDDKKSVFYADGERVPTSLFTSEVAQRVTLPRMQSSDSTPFYMDKLYFREGGGLYFMLDIQNEDYKEKIEAALKLLGDNGIGTDRNVGHGQFEYHNGTLTLNLPSQATELLSLSLFCPKSEEELPPLANSFYKLKKRGGWIASPSKESNAGLRKKSVYMFEEGSVFPSKQAAEWMGKIVDLKPGELPPQVQLDHSIWRDGTPFFIPVNLP